MSLGSRLDGAEPQLVCKVVSRPISVCHIISGDLWAGAEVQVASLLRAATRMPQLRIAAIVLNEGRLADELRSSGIDVCIISEWRYGFITILRLATEYLRSNPADILHSHRYKENLLAYLLSRRLGHVHLVRTVHGWVEPFSGYRHWKQNAIFWLDNLIARHGTDCIISVSSDLLEKIAPRAGHTRTKVIHNGIDTDLVHSTLTSHQAKLRLGIEPAAPVAGFMGRISPIKRLDIFVDVCRRIRAEVPGSRFLVVGSGEGETDLRHRLAELHMDDSVICLGHRDDAYDVLRAMDVLIMSSDHEGLPMVVLEALYLGVPVVARAVGGIREVIGRGTNGIVIDSSDPADIAAACMNVLRAGSPGRDPAVTVNMIRQKFSADETAARVVELYGAVCAGSL